MYEIMATSCEAFCIRSYCTCSPLLSTALFILTDLLFNSHGVASFSEIARIVATNWKVIDHKTMEFVTIVSNVLKAFVNEHGLMPSNTRKKKKALKPVKVASSVGGALIKETKEPTAPLDLNEANSLDINDSSSFLSMPFVAPDLPPTSKDLINIAVDVMSMTPQVSNTAHTEWPASNSFTAATVSHNDVLSNGISNDLLSNMEQQSLLFQQVMGTTSALGGYYGTGIVDQPQNISSLMAVMNAMNDQKQQPYERTASMGPGCMPESDAELQRRRAPAQQRSASSMTLGSAEIEVQLMLRASSSMTLSSSEADVQRMLNYQQQCRASTSSIAFGSPLLGQAILPNEMMVKELEIGDDEILRMYHGATGHPAPPGPNAS